MTALPIIETLAGDVSAYIPTNVISITDGQIYLEKDLFFSGQRPAVTWACRSPVWAARAQTKAVKKSAGTLRIDLARFRELEVFTQFSSDLDKETRQALDHGKRLMEILKQPLYNPMPVWKQAVILYVATSGLLSDVDLEKITPSSRASAKAWRPATPTSSRRSSPPAPCPGPRRNSCAPPWRSIRSR